jgi:hypothetical protein
VRCGAAASGVGIGAVADSVAHELEELPFSGRRSRSHLLLFVVLACSSGEASRERRRPSLKGLSWRATFAPTTARREMQRIFRRFWKLPALLPPRYAPDWGGCAACEAASSARRCQGLLEDKLSRRACRWRGGVQCEALHSC